MTNWTCQQQRSSVITYNPASHTLFVYRYYTTATMVPAAYVCVLCSLNRDCERLKLKKIPSWSSLKSSPQQLQASKKPRECCSWGKVKFYCYLNWTTEKRNKAAAASDEACRCNETRISNSKQNLLLERSAGGWRGPSHPAEFGHNSDVTEQYRVAIVRAGVVNPRKK